MPKTDQTSLRLARIEKQLNAMQTQQRSLIKFEEKTEDVVERKVYEIRALSYLTLVICSVLLAMVLGMVLNALGFRLG